MRWPGAAQIGYSPEARTLDVSVGPHVIYGGETMIPDRFFDVIMKSI